MATPWAAINTFLYVNDTSVSPPAYVKIAAVDDVDGPNLKTDTIDVTTMDTVNRYKQYIASLKDGQNVTGQIVWDPTDPSHNETAFYSVKTMFEDSIIRTFKIVFPTSPKQRFIFSGFVDNFHPMAKVKDALRANFSIKVTDSVPQTSGS